MKNTTTLLSSPFCELANLKCLDEIWADSIVNAEELFSRGFDPAMVRILPLAVEPPPLAALAQKRVSPVNLLFVGRTVPSNRSSTVSGSLFQDDQVLERL